MNKQLPSPFWPDLDSNLSEAGIFVFRIAGGLLLTAVRATHFSQRMARLARIELTEHQLRYHTQTISGDFGVVTAIPVLASPLADNQVLNFTVDTDQIERLAKAFEGETLFKFDRADGCLTWREAGKNIELNLQASWVPANDVNEQELLIGQIPSETLRSAISFTSVLAGRRTKDSFPYQGVRIGAGAARGGYFAGASRYQSPLIPPELDFLLPRNALQNASAAIAKTKGMLTVSETETTIRVGNSNTQLFWSKTDAWPLTLDKMFDRPALASIVVNRQDLLKVGCCLSIPSLVHFKATPDKLDGATIIRVFGASSKGIFYDVLKGDWVRPEEAVSTEGWDFSITSSDFLDVVCAIKSDFITLSMTDRCLMLGSKDGDFETTTLLMGIEPS